jgi:hypothetical protein
MYLTKIEWVFLGLLAMNESKFSPKDVFQKSLESYKWQHGKC